MSGDLTAVRLALRHTGERVRVRAAALDDTLADRAAAIVAAHAAGMTRRAIAPDVGLTEQGVGNILRAVSPPTGQHQTRAHASALDMGARPVGVTVREVQRDADVSRGTAAAAIDALRADGQLAAAPRGERTRDRFTIYTTTEKP